MLFCRLTLLILSSIHNNEIFVTSFYITKNIHWFLLFLCIWQIYFKRKKTGGISFNSTVQLTHVDEKLCYQILHEYKIHNAEVHSLIAVFSIQVYVIVLHLIC